jgi:hypothetical protein
MAIELTKEEQMRAISEGIKEAMLVVFQFNAVQKDDLLQAMAAGAASGVVTFLDDIPVKDFRRMMGR